MTTTNLDTLHARHADLRARRAAVASQMADHLALNAQGLVAEDAAFFARVDDLRASERELLAEETEVAEMIHAAQRQAAPATEAGPAIRVSRVNVAALERGYGGEIEDIFEGRVRAGKSWVEGSAADLRQLAEGARDMADDNWTNELECGTYGEINSGFEASLRERCIKATDRAAAIVLEAIA